MHGENDHPGAEEEEGKEDEEDEEEEDEDDDEEDVSLKERHVAWCQLKNLKNAGLPNGYRLGFYSPCGKYTHRVSVVASSVKFLNERGVLQITAAGPPQTPNPKPRTPNPKPQTPNPEP